MDRVLTKINASHLLRYHSKLHVLQNSILINVMFLNRNIGRKRISMVQPLCNSHSVDNFVHFQPICKKDRVDEQLHKDRYVSS